MPDLNLGQPLSQPLVRNTFTETQAPITLRFRKNTLPPSNAILYSHPYQKMDTSWLFPAQIEEHPQKENSEFLT